MKLVFYELSEVKETGKFVEFMGLNWLIYGFDSNTSCLFYLSTLTNII
jgi:hypothetical protein